MIVSRYITTEIAKPLFVGCIALALVFASYRSAVNLTDAASGLLQPITAVKLILLQTLIALEVLLPTALYLSVVVGLGRLHKDSEMIALGATGYGEKKVLGTVLRFSLIVAVVVAILSTIVRPWAYQTSYQLEAQSEAQTDVTALDAEHFYPVGSTNSILFAENINHSAGRLNKVFVQSGNTNQSMIIYAQEAYRPPNKPHSTRSMVFLDGHAYQLSQTNTRDRLLTFRSLTVQLPEEQEINADLGRRAVATNLLYHSDKPKDIAEFQWRLSTPLAAILLALLAVPLSRTSPRMGRHSGMVIAILLYAVFFNLTGIAKTWVEQGLVGSMPGLWWPYSIPAILFAFLLLHPNWVPGFKRQ